MWRRVAQIVGYVLLWAVVIAYVVVAALFTTREREDRTISKVDIVVEESAATGHLTTPQQVREWIATDHIPTIGVHIDSVDVAALRSAVVRNGFVDRVGVYVSSDGVIHMNVSQRRPVVRFMFGGRNAYMTTDGYIFAAPASSAIYVPVVTGEYRSIVDASYEGMLDDYIQRLRSASNSEVKRLEESKNDIYREEARVSAARSAFRKDDKPPRKSWWPSKTRKEKYKAEYQAWKRSHRNTLRAYSDTLQMIAQRIDEVNEGQHRERKNFEQQRLRCNDLMELMRFVCRISDDDFWHKEVVQIVVSSSSSDEMEVTLIPRSGNFRIELGTLDNIERKLSRLRRFYAEALVGEGWNRYGTICAKYDNQIVCKE